MRNIRGGYSEAPAGQGRGDAKAEAAGTRALSSHSTTPHTQAYPPDEATAGVHCGALAGLPAMRRTRAEALLALMDRDSSDVFDLKTLSRWLVPQYRGDGGGFTAAQLERAIDDLAAADMVAITPGRHRGTIQIERWKAVAR